MGGNMLKVLLLDTNVSSEPIYKSLLEKGYEVYVAGAREDDCLAKLCKNYIKIDYSNIEDLKKTVIDYCFDFIVPGCNDVSYYSASHFSDSFFGLDSVETTTKLNDKYQFRLFAKEKKLNVPCTFTREETLSKKMTFIVKPVDAFSGRGISVVYDNSPSKIDEAIANAISYSKQNRYIIEEYIEGQLYSHSAFLVDRKITSDFFVIEHATANKFTVDTSHVVHNFPSNIASKIRKQVEIIAENLSLKDGLMHTQFIRNKSDFRIVEVTRRCPGDLYSLLIEKSTGFEYAEVYTTPFLNQKIKKSSELSNNNIIRHTISLNHDSAFTGIRFNNDMKIDYFIPLSTTGDKLKASPFGRLGLIFISCKSKSDLKKIYANILNRDVYNII